MVCCVWYSCAYCICTQNTYTKRTGMDKTHRLYYIHIVKHVLHSENGAHDFDCHYDCAPYARTPYRIYQTQNCTFDRYTRCALTSGRGEVGGGVVVYIKAACQKGLWCVYSPEYTFCLYAPPIYVANVVMFHEYIGGKMANRFTRSAHLSLLWCCVSPCKTFMVSAWIRN